MIPVCHFVVYDMEKRVFRLTLALDGRRPGHDRETLRFTDGSKHDVHSATLAAVRSRIVG